LHPHPPSIQALIEASALAGSTFARRSTPARTRPGRGTIEMPYMGRSLIPKNQPKLSEL
jgi:hypothetical protein